MNDFDGFWTVYPRRVGKLDAMKAYTRARRLASAADILAGVERYKQSKPEYADWSHPSTWLNKGRWMDEPDEPFAVIPAKNLHRENWWNAECLHTPKCSDFRECREMTRAAKAS